MKPPRYMVIVCREGVSQVFPFDDLEAAYAFYKGPATEQWSESFLVVVLKGPQV
jgi:hypothetical protein